LGISIFGMGEEVTRMLSVLGIIPARGGSKGIPHKNLQLLNGKPLIAYSIEAAQHSKQITRLVVSTDDPEIAQVSRAYNVDVPFLRPQSLASDTAGQVEVVEHALRAVEELDQTTYEVIVLLQPTSPLRSYQDIDNALSLLNEDNVDAITSFVLVEQGHPYYMYTIKNERAVPLLEIPQGITRRQQFPAIYLRNGAIYAVRREAFLAQKQLYGFANSRTYIMPYSRSVNIDTMTDLMLAEVLLKAFAD
jgi:CMP-N-acetylneuraminic acid synthetase